MTRGARSVRRTSGPRLGVPPVPPPRSQRGVAVLTAMLVVTIGTVIAVNLMWEATLDQRRTMASLAADQGLMYAQGAEAWAADILREDLVESPDADHMGEPWATELPPLPVEGGVITGRLEDLQGRFNLNNLVQQNGEADPVARAQFERLLSTVGLDPAIAGAVVDWLDPDIDMQFPDGGEDAAYASTDPPYRTPNSLITSPSELMAVNGMDRETYAALAPYVTALPIGTTLNVNTASDVVLASLSETLDLSQATSLVEERGDAGFADVDSVFSGLVEPDMLQRIDSVTEHFLLTATVTLGTTQLTMRSVLQRDASGITRPLFRSLGVE
ncbi:MAG: type II secretion system minor pseudopilin GspK [Gammaproteobacteria bacterium]|nr:type II secretion system minor pseudopilin GspK [Gammaproteobacteria bacterium]